MATACDSLEVDLSRVDLDVTWETQPCIDVEVEQVDITIEAVTVANQGPKGDTGAQGPIGPPGTPGTPGGQGLPGAAATLVAGSTVTTAPGTNATVTNSGSSSAAIFNFAIPQGAVGAAGPQGLQGNTGAQGSPGPQGQTGLQGPKGDPGAQGATGNTGAQGTPGATGAQGPQGTVGTAGQPAYTLSSAGFTVPAVGSSVTVSVADTSWVAIGEILYIQDAGGAGVAGAMQVTAKTPTSLTLLNVATASGVGSGSGDMTKAVYDVNGDNVVDKAATLSTPGAAKQFWKNANVWAQVDYTDLTSVPSTFAPSVHAINHKSGGSDAIALDTLAATTDITALNASATAHGLLAKLSNVAAQYLNGVGAWSNPTQGPFDLKAQTVTQSGATLAINRALGENCTLSLTASITSITVTAWPTTGNTGKVRLIVSNTGAFAISGWPAGTIWPGGTAPTITSGAGKKDIILLMSDDAGTTIYGSIVGQDYR